MFYVMNRDRQTVGTERNFLRKGHNMAFLTLVYAVLCGWGVFFSCFGLSFFFCGAWFVPSGWGVVFFCVFRVVFCVCCSVFVCWVFFFVVFSSFFAFLFFFCFSLLVSSSSRYSVPFPRREQDHSASLPLCHKFSLLFQVLSFSAHFFHSLRPELTHQIFSSPLPAWKAYPSFPSYPPNPSPSPHNITYTADFAHISPNFFFLCSWQLATCSLLLPPASLLVHRSVLKLLALVIPFTFISLIAKLSPLRPFPFVPLSFVHGVPPYVFTFRMGQELSWPFGDVTYVPLPSFSLSSVDLILTSPGLPRPSKRSSKPLSLL